MSAYAVCCMQNAVRFQIEMEVSLKKTQPIYLFFEVPNNIRNINASQQEWFC